MPVFLQCDFEQSELVDGLQEAIDFVETGRGTGFTKITRSPCFFELMRTQRIPAPLISLTAQRIRQEWERQGSREI